MKGSATTTNLYQAGIQLKALPQVQLLGEAKVWVNPQKATAWYHLAPDKPHFLLAYLAYKQDWVSREHLANLFWGETTTSAARRNLRKILFKIRTLDWFDDFEEGVPGLRWQSQTDLEQFQTALDEQNWQAAIESYGGQLLEGLDIKGSPAFAEWLELERMRLEQLYLEARESYSQELETQGRFDEAIRFIQETLKTDRLNEAAHRSLMRLEHKRGNSEAVFEQFEYLRDTLKQELGVEPLEETVSLLKELEQGGASQGRSALILTNPAFVPDKPEKLLGREILLAEAGMELEANRRILIHGFGGMGKTAFAATLSSQYLEKGNTRILWMQVGSENPDAVFDALAYPFKAQQDLAQSKNKAETLRNILVDNKIGLIILDDVWNAYSLSRVIEAVPRDIKLIVTSRQRYPRLKCISLGRLERQAALELLSLHAKKTIQDEEESDKLCTLLGDHAFAIRIAGLTIRENQISIQALNAQIKNAPHNLKIPGDFAQENRQSVASLLNVSLEPLEDLPYEAFLTYGALASSSATPQLLAYCLRRESEDVENALFTLVQRGLAERLTQAGSDQVSYRIHDLAHAYAKANKFHRPTSIIKAGLEYLKNNRDDVEILENEISNLLGAAQRAKELDKKHELVDYMIMLAVEGNYFASRGHRPASVTLLEDAANASKNLKYFEKAHHLFGKLGEYSVNFAGNSKQALLYYEQARNLARKTGNICREAIYQSLIGVSMFHCQNAEFNTHLDRAHKLAKATGDDECLCRVLDHMGYVAGLSGNTQQANQHLRESLGALDRLEKRSLSNQGTLIKSRFFSLLNLGETEFKLGHFEDALENRKSALALAQTHNNELWIGIAKLEIGEMYCSKQSPGKAKSYLEDALELFQKNNVQKYVEVVNNLLKEGV